MLWDHSILERSETKRDFTRNNFRTRVVCDVVCDLVGRDVLGAPRAWGHSAVAGRRGRRPLPAFRSTVSFESCGPFGSGMPREEEISRGATSVPESFAMSSVIWRAVTSSARRAHGDVPLSRAAEDVGPYQRSGLRCHSRAVVRDVLGAPRAWGRSAVAGRRGRRPLPAFRSTVSFESCGP